MRESDAVTLVKVHDCAAYFNASLLPAVTVISHCMSLGSLWKLWDTIPVLKVERWIKKLLHFFGNMYLFAGIDGPSVRKVA